MLPYSADVQAALMAAYNTAWFPAAPLGVLLALVVWVTAFAGPAAGWRAPVTAVVLVVFWAWVGLVHQFGLMAGVNFMAPVYGVAWLAEAALFAVLALRGGLWFGSGLRRAIGMAIAAYGVVGHPLVVWLAGEDVWALPLVGTAPDPTVIFTAGLLAAAPGRSAAFLLVIPATAAAVAGYTAHALAFWPAYAVPVSVAAAVATRALPEATPRRER